MAALAAMAASAADPPRARISAAACEASTWSLATIPPRVITIERASARSSPTFGIWAEGVSTNAEARSNPTSTVVCRMVVMSLEPEP